MPRKSARLGDIRGSVINDVKGFLNEGRKYIEYDLITAVLGH